jgi:hypothetical protein
LESIGKLSLFFLKIILALAFDSLYILGMSERSPKFPGTPLKEIVASVERIYKEAGRSPLDSEGIVKIIGYTGLNGASRAAFASLNGYGVLAKDGSGFRVSEEALGAIRPMDENDRLKHIRKLALNPPLFSEIYSQHKDCSESVLATVLVRKGFTDEGARRAAKVWKENFEFAKLGAQGYTGENNEAEKGKGDVPNNLEQTRTNPPDKDKTSMDKTINPGELPIPIAGGVARIPFPMTEDDFELFIGTLNLWKKKIVRKLTAIPPSVSLPANAMWKNADSNKPVIIVAVMGERDGEQYYKSEDGTGIPASQLTF